MAYKIFPVELGSIIPYIQQIPRIFWTLLKCLLPILLFFKRGLGGQESKKTPHWQHFGTLGIIIINIKLYKCRV